MAKFGLFNGEVGLSITGRESLPELNEAALDYASETMAGSANKACSWWPVFEQNERRDEQIGWLTIAVVDTVFVIEHFTLDRKRLSSDWKSCEFYAGKYDLM